MLNPAVLKPLFRVQTRPWQKLVEDHLDKIFETTIEISLKLCRLATPNMTESGRSSLESLLSKLGENSKEHSMQQLKELFRRKNDTALQTTDDHFSTSIRNARHERFQIAISRFDEKYVTQDIRDRVSGNSHYQE